MLCLDKKLALFVFLLIILIALCGCSDEKGPTVPGNTTTPVELVIERNQEIRIGMISFTPAPKVFFSITRGTYDIILGADNVPGHSGFPGQTWHVEVRDDKFLTLVDNNGKKHEIPQEYITVKLAEESTEGGHILIGDNKKNMRPYRGKFKIAVENDRLLAINIVPMEEYLLGVVPAEMPPSWHPEALKAQAIAARSYAYFNFGRFEFRNFDSADTVISQAYAGVFAENEATTNAVVDTEGLVLTHDGNLANTLYHSTCGGKTAAATEIFNPNSEVPYLVSVEDNSPWDYDYCRESSLYEWERTYDMNQLHTVLQKSVYTDPGEELSSLTIASRTPSGWADYVHVSGVTDHTPHATKFRRALNKHLENNAIPSTNFEILFSDGSYTFSGRGYGHGVGLCQWGAKGRADDGIGYENILGYYYQGCEVTEIPYSEGLKFYRDEDFFLMSERQRNREEIMGLGREYIPPEELEPEEDIEGEQLTPEDE